MDSGISIIDNTESFKRFVQRMGAGGVYNAVGLSVAIVLADAKRNAPVDTGRLRNSITGLVTGSIGTTEIKGVVGTTVLYAPFIEFGTKPHFPPVSALATWARRKGLNAFVIARKISVKGTKAQKFMQKAIDANRTTVKDTVQKAIEEMMK